MPSGLRPPTIQILLRKAQSIEDRLKREPWVTRWEIARELGVTVAYVTRIRNLIHLARPIQEYILSMPPTDLESQITEKRLRDVLRYWDPKIQIALFEQILKLRPRAKRPPPSRYILTR